MKKDLGRWRADPKAHQKAKKLNSAHSIDTNEWMMGFEPISCAMFSIVRWNQGIFITPINQGRKNHPLTQEKSIASSLGCQKNMLVPKNFKQVDRFLNGYMLWQPNDQTNCPRSKKLPFSVVPAINFQFFPNQYSHYRMRLHPHECFLPNWRWPRTAIADLPKAFAKVTFFCTQKRRREGVFYMQQGRCMGAHLFFWGACWLAWYIFLLLDKNGKSWNKDWRVFRYFP